ncbi:recombination mediator RecR [Paracoccaceae bacterium GXU_MW_L88]
MSASPEIEEMIALLARLPGLGPRSARRVALTLIRKRGALLEPLAQAMAKVAETARDCVTCGNIASESQCEICADPRRANGQICVVENVADLWAMERGGAFKGRYHVLGGLLSALDGVGPDELRIPALKSRVTEQEVQEIILALPATIDGQTTAHYIAGELGGVQITSLAQGVPIGGELDYLDDGTIGAALMARKAL